MNHVEEASELAMPAEHWEIPLRDGDHISVFTHAYSVEGAEVVFSLLFKGSPNFEVDTLRIPLSLLPDGFS
ncbi:hypothetical protein [uncultured Friedmanniella sp.]|uniref:hypothetical protein n=1 Tax=uncultured Friedmanniella sp. TaxID=335381 RepID=UPI0035CA2359